MLVNVMSECNECNENNFPAFLALINPIPLRVHFDSPKVKGVAHRLLNFNLSKSTHPSLNW